MRSGSGKRDLLEQLRGPRARAQRRATRGHRGRRDGAAVRRPADRRASADRVRSAAPGRLPRRRVPRSLLSSAVRGPDDLVARERAPSLDASAPRGSRPIAAMAVSDLPEPDSPMRPEALARFDGKRQVGDERHRPGADGEVPRPRGTGHRPRPPRRVADIAQAVGQQVHADHQEHAGRCRALRRRSGRCRRWPAPPAASRPHEALGGGAPSPR